MSFLITDSKTFCNWVVTSITLPGLFPGFSEIHSHGFSDLEKIFLSSSPLFCILPDLVSPLPIMFLYHILGFFKKYFLPLEWKEKYYQRVIVWLCCFAFFFLYISGLCHYAITLSNLSIFYFFAFPFHFLSCLWKSDCSSQHFEQYCRSLIWCLASKFVLHGELKQSPTISLSK